MAEELGAAVLRVTVRTDEALQALNAFRTQVSQQLGDVGQVNFRGLEQGAAQAGQRTGRALAQGITQATQGLRFESIREALDFSGALNGTLRDLRQYQTALVALREVTPATARGFVQLNDVIEATSQAIRNYSASTDRLQDDAARVAIREQAAAFRQQRAALREQQAALREQQAQVREAAQEDRAWAGAIRTIEQAQRSAAAATREAAQAAREQRRAYLDLARTGVGAVGGVAKAAGAVGKGAIGAVRTGVNVGRAAYGIGAELGILEEAKPGVLNALLKSTLDRFAFIGKQAQTTRGRVLRTLEAVGAGSGLIELARNADLLRESLKALSVTAKATDASVSAFAKFGNYFANSGLGSIGPLRDLFKGFADLETGTAAITSFTDQLIQIGTKGLSGSVDAIEALVNGFGQLPPAAQAAALAAPAVFSVIAGPAGKQAEVQLRKLKALLDGLGTTSLNVEGQLRDALNAIAEQEGLLKRAPLALPSSDLLQQRLRDTGSRQPQRLEPGVLNAVNNAGLGIAEQYTRQLEAGARAVKSQRDQYIAVQVEASKLLETDLRRQQILNSIARQRAAAPGFGAASAANFGQVDPVEKAIRRNREAVAQAEERAQKRRDLLAQDLGDVQARRVAVQKSILKLEETERAAASRRAQDALKQLQDTATTRERRQQAAEDRQAQLRAQDFERRLAAVQERNRAREDRRRRFGEAGSNALIGGAFPLLFGQGIGASIGGAAGGGLGGFAGGQLGFGLSLLGTAVGAQFDLATQKAGTLAAALKDPIGRFSELQQAGLLSSKGLERQVEALISTGRAAEAAALIQQDLANTYGALGNAKALADQSDRLGRSWSQLTITLADLVVSPVADLLKSTSDGLKGFVAAIAAVRDVLPRLSSFEPEPVAAARRATQGTLLSNSLPGGLGQLANFVSIGGRGLGILSGLFGGSGGGGQPSPQVKAATEAQKELVRLTQQQAVAEARGNRVLAVGTQLIAARVKLQQDLAALSEEERKGPKGDQLRQQYQQTVAVTQAQATAAADGAERELAATRQLLGLSGDALTFEQERLRIAEARRQSEKAAADLAKVKADPNADAGAIQAAANLAKAQRAEYEKQVQLALNSSTTQLATSERELANTRQLIGLEGERLSIRQEQQRVAQAESEFNSLDTQFRQQYGGISPNTLSGAELDAYKAAYNFREAAEARVEQTRITALERTVRAEQALANERIAVERQLSAARVNLANAQQLSATPTFSTGEAGPARGAVQQVQAIRQAITQARQAAEDAARNVAQALARGVQGDALDQLQIVAKAAATDLRTALVTGSDALKSAAKQAFESLKQARLELARVVADPQGLNQYLPAGARQDRLDEQLQGLLPAFREAQRTFEKLTGFAAPDFVGTTVDVLGSVDKFVQQVEREQRARENVALNGKSLEIINSELTASNNNLATKIDALAAKSWVVQVNVPGGSASGDVIGAVNGGF